MRKIIPAGAALLAGLFTFGPSWAITCTDSTVTGSNACIDSGVLGSGPGGNPQDSYVNPFGDNKEWTVFDWRVGDPQLEGSETEITFGDWIISPNDGASFAGDTKSGTWSVNAWPTNYDDVAFAFKGGNGFALFRIDTSGETSGDWMLDKGLSNFRVFTTVSDPNAPPIPDIPSQVPLPAAAWLLLGGLGVLGSAKRWARI
ncbi:VPLPA-CTERM sorting domain-containing protein [Dinoroseobacter sp. S375]|uniref:VPLPA-CTERM sorting domain-containing protein n=1 Tax=Dinoroseobacter sp. S375 TaxID=3415136 RepID=UPI003C79E101